MSRTEVYLESMCRCCRCYSTCLDFSVRQTQGSCEIQMEWEPVFTIHHRIGTGKEKSHQEWAGIIIAIRQCFICKYTVLIRLTALFFTLNKIVSCLISFSFYPVCSGGWLQPPDQYVSCEDCGSTGIEWDRSHSLRLTLYCHLEVNETRFQTK